jgi:hypothetical protein
MHRRRYHCQGSDHDFGGFPLTATVLIDCLANVFTWSAIVRLIAVPEMNDLLRRWLPVPPCRPGFGLPIRLAAAAAATPAVASVGRTPESG